MRGSGEVVGRVRQGSGEGVVREWRGSGEGVAREWHVQYYCVLTKVLVFPVYMEEKVKLFQQFTWCSKRYVLSRGNISYTYVRMYVDAALHGHQYDMYRYKHYKRMHAHMHTPSSPWWQPLLLSS